MANELKRMFLEKISKTTINKEFLLRNSRNVNVAYKHNEKCFSLSLTRNHDGTVQPQHQPEQNNNQEQIQCRVDRNIFIKNIIESCNNKEPQPLPNTQKIVIDFSSPNIAKPFHAGHLRSTIIGNFIANINKYYNNNVTKLNYLGDWGTQFGLLQYGLKSKNITLDTLQTNTLKTLYEAYVYANKQSTSDDNILEEARRYFADIEQGKANLEGWMKVREVTKQEIDRVYQRLGINFDEYHWESDYNSEAIKGLMTSLESKDIIKKDVSGKKIVTVNGKDITVLKSDNSTLYLARDIAALIDRYKRYNFDKMLYVVDNSQTDHFNALFQIVQRIDEDCTKGCKHIKFGRVKGMSTRNGNVVFLNDLLDEAKDKMFEKQKQSKNTRNSAINEETCDILGTTAVVINDLKQRRQKDYNFSWDRALQSEGDSGIKLQYLHCRLWSLEKNCGVLLPEICDPNYLPEEVVGDVITELSKFEVILNRALYDYEACIIVNYLFRLSRHVNRMFNELNIKNVNQDLAAQRLLVFNSARKVVKTGLEILGVKPLNEM